METRRRAEKSPARRGKEIANSPAKNIVQKTKARLFEYEKRHQRIIGAAMRLFNAKGYAATTTASIAREAGVTEKTMYGHFESKESLFEACILSIAGQIAMLWQDAAERNKGDDLAYLRAVARSYVEFVINNPDKSMFLVHLYSYRVIPELDEGFRKAVEGQLSDIERVIGSLQKKGVIRLDIPPRVLAGAFIGQYFTAVFLNEFLGPERYDTETAMRMTDRFLGIA
jgi:AcrR family transcriptional regulator